MPDRKVTYDYLGEFKATRRLHELKLTDRTRKNLAKANLLNEHEIASRSMSELLRFPGIGHKMIHEIETMLKRLDPPLALAEERSKSEKLNRLREERDRLQYERSERYRQIEVIQEQLDRIEDEIQSLC